MSTAKTLAELGAMVAGGALPAIEEVVTERDDTDTVTEGTKSKKDTGKKDRAIAQRTVEEPVDPTVTEVVSEENVTLTKGDDEEDEVPDGFIVQEEKTVARQVVVRMAKTKCHVCRHLFPTLPDTLSKKLGGNGKAYGAEFSCYTEEGCPAQSMVLEYSPFTDEFIDTAVAEFKRTGDIDILNDLYTQAKETSQASWQDVHARVAQKLQD